MALDPVPTYPGQYDAVESNNNPDGSETRREGDDQIRRMKASEKETWTNVTGAVTASHEEINRLTGISLTDDIITFPSTTTKQLFYQDSAPAGWTIDIAVDEHSVRLTQGSVAGGVIGGTSGGTYDFSTQFAILAEGATPGVGDHTLIEAEIPSHGHGDGSHGHALNYSSNDGVLAWNAGGNVFANRASGGVPYMQGTATATKSNPVVASTGFIDNTGGDGAHGHSVDLRVKWAACIICTKV